jgi:hypothetical protein
MAEFAPNQPVVSQEPTVVVDKGLPLGIHVFQLRVEDDLGQSSAPTLVTVVVFGQAGPGPFIPPFIPPIIPPFRPPG